jgi:hypothetical protein
MIRERKKANERRLSGSVLLGQASSPRPPWAAAMGFWATLFPPEPRGRKGSSRKRRRTASLDRLAASFAQASLDRQARSSAPPEGYDAPLYRQEVVFPEPYGPPAVQYEARPHTGFPSTHAWLAPQPPRQRLDSFASAPAAITSHSWAYDHPAPSYAAPPQPLLSQSSPSHYAQHTPPPQPYYLAPARPTLPIRPVSDPTSAAPPSSPAKPNQCRGTTSTGRRCTRIVGGTSSASSSPAKGKPAAAALPLTEASLAQLNRVLSRHGRKAPLRARRPAAPPSDASSDDSNGDDEELPRFCHQHSKHVRAVIRSLARLRCRHIAQAMAEPGTYAGARGLWVRFDGERSLNR